TSLEQTPESHLNKMTRWGYGPTDARYMFLRFSDHEEEHGLQIEHTLRSMLGWQPTKVQTILSSAERARGDLLASLVGLTDDDLDTVPVEPEGEWPLRRTLAHALATEHNYRVNTLYYVERYRNSEEHAEPPSRLEPDDFLERSLVEFLTGLDTARNQSIAELSVLHDSDLAAPAVWSEIELDVNWRLMRFSHHEREHTAQIRKWRVQTGKHPTDAQRLLGLAWQTHGVLRGYLVGVTDELSARDPGDGEWSVNQTIDHMREADGFFRRMIEEAK
ncbi:MAG TPA: DinB family protein, partial [Thermomicrobiales bacterium]|nr:DinB family protein [Thermomicrobiales bacterium]